MNQPLMVYTNDLRMKGGEYLSGHIGASSSYPRGGQWSPCLMTEGVLKSYRKRNICYTRTRTSLSGKCHGYLMCLMETLRRLDRIDNLSWLSRSHFSVRHRVTETRIRRNETRRRRDLPDK